jgi:uncharacterized cupin superfamily protein
VTQVLTTDQLSSLVLEDGSQLPPFASASGDPTIGIRLLSGDGISPGTSAVWSCDRGTIRYEGLPGGEAGFVVSGRTRITEDGTEPLELGPGDGFVLEKGWSGTLDILEPVTKVFFLLAD